VAWLTAPVLMEGRIHGAEGEPRGLCSRQAPNAVNEVSFQIEHYRIELNFNRHTFNSWIPHCSKNSEIAKLLPPRRRKPMQPNSILSVIGH
jgi:hypothetical protein